MTSWKHVGFWSGFDRCGSFYVFELDAVVSRVLACFWGLCLVILSVLPTRVSLFLCCGVVLLCYLDVDNGDDDDDVTS